MLVRGILAGLALVVAISSPAQAAVARPSDPAYATQWGVQRARVNEAWSAVKGDPRVTIAIVDTGVSKLPDFGDRLLDGHDFVNNDDDASDDNGHGTMAAGVAAAAGNNRLGVAGICWFCRILPVKVLDATGAGNYDNFANGIRYAADHDATIISASFGGNDDSQSLRDAVSYATAKGSLVIAAAGNKGTSQPHYPAAIPAALAVGAVDAQGVRYSWSNYGPSWVDLTAPGCNPAQQRNGVIGDYCGTSSATPFVSGVAGLLAATDPAPSASTIRAALVAGARGGQVDAVGALNALPPAGDTTAPAVAVDALPALARGLVTVGAAAADQHGVARVEVYAGGRLIADDRVAPYSVAWQSAPRNGLVPLEFRAYDRAGNVTVVRRTLRVDNAAPAVKVYRNGRNVTARATDASGVARLELLINGKIIARYAGYLHQFRVPAGARTIGIRAVDKAGNARLVAAAR
ncbi:S8 family serine peptidase [Actinoplanes sp. NPDC026619]|uniref:S8 family serine peptidase n=1 Tax=Actinoplanes sp. NPDC026619 TaxID=3155798 RepID=UPI0033D27F27